MNLIQAPEYLISKQKEEISVAYRWILKGKCDKTVIIHLKLKCVFLRVGLSEWIRWAAAHLQDVTADVVLESPVQCI